MFAYASDYHAALEQAECSEIVRVRVTPAERERLRGAGKRGLSLSKYIRLKLLG
ncbi:hypothetical protein [Infirmifilum sp. SLHALR2]